MSGELGIDQDNLLDSLLGDFLDESDQLLTQLNENLLRLDEWVRSLEEDHCESCEADLMNEMFRAAHSIKGLSAMMGLGDINTLTHKIENVFDAARNDQLRINRDVVDLVFTGVDHLAALVELLKDPSGETVDCEEVLVRIGNLLQSADAERKQSSQADAEKALASAVEEAAAAVADPLAGVQNEENVSETYVAIFVDETETTLDELNETLLALEDAGDVEQLKKLLVTSHRIKGSAASIGLNRAARLTHLMEDLLQELVETGGALSVPSTDAMLVCTDALRHYVRQLRAGGTERDQFSEAAIALVASRSAETPHVAAAEGSDADDKSSDPSAGQAQAEHAARATFAGEVRFDPTLSTAALKASLIHEKLGRFGRIVRCEPSAEELDKLDTLEVFRFQVASNETREKLLEQIRVAGVESATLELLEGSTAASEPGVFAETTERSAADPPPAATAVPQRPGAEAPVAQVESAEAKDPKAAPAKKPAVDTGSRPIETVRGDIERLDDLMNLAGQLVINKAQFSRIGEKLQSTLGSQQWMQSLDRALGEVEKMSGLDTARVDSRHSQTQLQHFRGQARRVQSELEGIRREMLSIGQARNAVKDLLETIHQFDRVSNAVQQAVMDTRMVPIGPLFTRFNRVIRDIARDTGKDIRLEIQGEKTELDKRMIDELSDPLIHMVRNSADHGIESPDQRAAAGKPRQGTVRLDACHRGNSIVIQVRDDGKGLDTDRILRKCLAKGILTEADAEKMTPRQIHQMIWVPGMSTAEKVTGVSGRGMGMDIVKSKIDGLNGTVDIDSAPGKGTTMTIKLPVTLAILPSLMVEVGGDVFAMPMESVTEIVSFGQEKMSTVHGRQMVTVRDRVVSLVSLGDVLSFRRARQDETVRPRETTMVIVGETGQEIGLAVDRVIGEEDIVIKSIAENYKNVSGIAGASILGDGRVSLILDVPALIDTAGRKSATASC